MHVLRRELIFRMDKHIALLQLLRCPVLVMEKHCVHSGITFKQFPGQRARFGDTLYSS